MYEIKRYTQSNVKFIHVIVTFITGYILLFCVENFRVVFFILTRKLTFLIDIYLNLILPTI